MRVLFVFCFMLAAALHAATADSAQPPSLSGEELKEFCERTTIGGGSLTTFEHGGRKIAVVMRCFTSGVRSSDFGVYAALPDGRYHRVLYREPLWGSFFRPSQAGDLIAVFLQPMSSHAESVVFTFTISGCYTPQDK